MYKSFFLLMSLSFQLNSPVLLLYWHFISRWLKKGDKKKEANKTTIIPQRKSIQDNVIIMIFKKGVIVVDIVLLSLRI